MAPDQPLFIGDFHSGPRTQLLSGVKQHRTDTRVCLSPSLDCELLRGRDYVLDHLPCDHSTCDNAWPIRRHSVDVC